MPKEIKVKARKKLNDDQSIHVKKGDKFRFVVCKSNCWYDMGIPSSADGFRNPFFSQRKARFPKAKCFALCGTIDDDPEHHFLIGTGECRYTVTKDGELYFFANDKSGWYWNNAGSVKLNVYWES